MNVVPVDKNDISKCMVDIETRLEHLTGVLENVTGNNSAEGRIIDEIIHVQRSRYQMLFITILKIF